MSAINPQNLLDQLVGELGGIERKRLDDNRWFEFGDGDHLVLRDRPMGFLDCVWEALARLFTNKLSRLEEKFVWITDQVEQYLSVEGDQKRLGAFLNRYTESLNEIFRCATRMQEAGRISVQTMNALRARARFGDMVRMNIETQLVSGREVRAYERVAYLSFSSEVRGDLDIQFPENSGVPDLALRYGKTAECEIPNLRGDQLAIDLSIHKQCGIGVHRPGIYEISLRADGLFDYKRQGDSQYFEASFLNQTAGRVSAMFEMRIEDGKETISPGNRMPAVLEPSTKSEPVSLPFKGGQDMFTFFTEYMPATQVVRLGCKSALYEITIGADGRLTGRATPIQAQNRSSQR